MILVINIITNRS